jgi:hypothetical protein
MKLMIGSLVLFVISTVFGQQPSFSEPIMMDSAARHRVLTESVAALKHYYANRAIATRTANALTAHEKAGDDERAVKASDFATLVTRQMREASDDHELELVYSDRTLPEVIPPQSSASLPPGYREEMQRTNCTFTKVEILPHNVGYLKFDTFPSLSVCEHTVKGVMKKVNGVDALIIDLRDNRGGFGAAGSLIASYLFDHPVYWFNPRENTSRNSWLRSPVTGSKLPDRPVFVLTSGTTISAAEQFTYNLKMLKRATIVGETTAGGAHAAVFHRLEDHFGIAITEVNAINPYSKYDWNGVGIEPDVRIKADTALAKALSLMNAGSQGK